MLIHNFLRVKGVEFDDFCCKKCEGTRDNMCFCEINEIWYELNKNKKDIYSSSDNTSLTSHL